MPPFPRPGKSLLDELHERPAVAIGFAIIGVVVALIAAAFVFVAGWLSSSRVSGVAVVDAMQAHNGIYASFRRAHPKGMCFVGHFDSNGQGQALSRAQVFEPGHIPVFGRFSLGVGGPDAADGMDVFHSMALNFTQRDGQIWRAAINDVPIFPVATAPDFVAFLQATMPAASNGKPDPDKVAAFMAKHPETMAFVQWLKDHPIPSSFANGTYYSVNAFGLVDTNGHHQSIRWSLVPEAPWSALDKSKLEAMNKANKDFLFDEMIARLGQGPTKLAGQGAQRWHMLITLAQTGDPTNNATVQWPADRKQIDVGTLVVDKAILEDDGPCRNVTFDPLLLPKGIEASDDPLLAARSAVYSVSLTRRSAEPPQPSPLANDPAAQGAR